MLPLTVFIDIDRMHSVLLQAYLKAVWLLARNIVAVRQRHHLTLQSQYRLGPSESF